ncbi:MAG: thioredoxin family protein [marine benthic group bacterium]|jgi:thiol-disulfide isomerase/thioredoxin|nr:thioredoxin family protein [Gemmatimonadota bacterium]MCL7937150.1 thioredoxin family protein [Gemmatimonadota bacterium]MCL7964921.1 thioredoxin family protein [Gemmatimonadota bacterium]MCL7965867.1 thioredoxin family protein [Gemmatimonadota bacterium]MCL7968183.1 thioredoxin family protein [Gemmatimonadota bacterium]
MAETPSTMLALGTPVPTFQLEDAVSGRIVSGTDYGGSRALLVMFICNHCPFVKHVVGELGRLGEDYLSRGVGIVAINSNDVRLYPQDGPERMKELADGEGWGFPFLLDDTQEVAKKFRAACTPDFFLFGSDGRLAYRGQLDDSRPRNGRPVTGRDLRAALDAVLEDRPVPEPQVPSVGCNIKWTTGNAPNYYG